jgi:HlyD family type I secretion membrane fusion protein
VGALKAWLAGQGPEGEEPAEAREVRKWGRRGAAAALGSLALLLLWGVAAPLDSAVIGHGQLKVESYRQVVQHQEGGIVKAIQVRNGDEVRQGQTLIVLEDVRVSASLDLLDQQYFSELAKNARLRAEREMSTRVAWPAELEAAAKRPEVAEIRHKEADIFHQRRTILNQQVDILGRQAKDAADEAAATERQVQADNAGTRTMRDEARANRALLDKGYISPTRMLAFDRAEADYASRLAEHEADLARARQKQSDLLFRIEGLRNTYRETAASELKESNDRLNELQQRVKPALDASERQKITAPADGVVVELKVHTLGAVVGPRETLMEIVPRDRALVAELKLPTEAVSDLTLGMTAEVRLTAFEQRTTPLVKGRLEYLSADALSDPGVQQPPYYLARVALDEQSLKDARVGPLQAGMPVEAYLRVRSRTAIGYLFDPVTQSLGRAFRER